MPTNPLSSYPLYRLFARQAERVPDRVAVSDAERWLTYAETALRRLPRIRDLAVVLGESSVGGKQSIAYYVPDPALPKSEPAAPAGRVLPRHMAPGCFVRMAELPRSPSGKTDRRALTEWRTGVTHQSERTS